METTASIFQFIERIMEFRKIRGSVVNILNLKKQKLINLGEAVYLLIAPRYHSDYGLCYLGPVFHPAWRLTRACVRVVSALKGRLLPDKMA